MSHYLDAVNRIETFSPQDFEVEELVININSYRNGDDELRGNYSNFVFNFVRPSVLIPFVKPTFGITRIRTIPVYNSDGDLYILLQTNPTNDAVNRVIVKKLRLFSFIEVAFRLRNKNPIFVFVSNRGISNELFDYLCSFDQILKEFSYYTQI